MHKVERSYGSSSKIIWTFQIRVGKAQQVLFDTVNMASLGGSQRRGLM